MSSEATESKPDTIAAVVSNEQDDEEVPESTCSDPAEYRPFTFKKWNLVTTWEWDVDCDTCAICRLLLMEDCISCQSETEATCSIVWGDCNHAYHLCCMSQWIKQNNRCPLCLKDWNVQKTCCR